MRTSQKGIDLIKSFESCRLTTYKDSVGINTIGWGSTGPLAKPGNTITQEQADQELVHDLSLVESAVTRLIRPPINVNQNQFDALVAFSYNVGVNALKNSHLLIDFNKGDFKGAADQFLRWDHAGGETIPGLTRRRTAERELFLS